MHRPHRSAFACPIGRRYRVAKSFRDFRKARAVYDCLPPPPGCLARPQFSRGAAMMIDRRFFLGAAALCALACASGGHTAAAQTPQVETVNPGQLTVVFSPAAPPTS